MSKKKKRSYPSVKNVNNISNVKKPSSINAAAYRSAGKRCITV